MRTDRVVDLLPKITPLSLVLEVPGRNGRADKERPAEGAFPGSF